MRQLLVELRLLRIRKRAEQIDHRRVPVPDPPSGRVELSAAYRRRRGMTHSLSREGMRRPLRT
jgi:hypothetical protein